jgi:hypothetical protein
MNRRSFITAAALVAAIQSTNPAAAIPARDGTHFTVNPKTLKDTFINNQLFAWVDGKPTWNGFPIVVDDKVEPGVAIFDGPDGPHRWFLLGSVFSAS